MSGSKFLCLCHKLTKNSPTLKKKRGRPSGSVGRAAQVRLHPLLHVIPSLALLNFLPNPLSVLSNKGTNPPKYLNRRRQEQTEFFPILSYSCSNQYFIRTKDQITVYKVKRLAPGEKLMQKHPQSFIESFSLLFWFYRPGTLLINLVFNSNSSRQMWSLKNILYSTFSTPNCRHRVCERCGVFY